MLLPITNSEFVQDMLLATNLAGQLLEYAAKRRGDVYDEEDVKQKTPDGAWLVRKKSIRDALKKILTLQQKQRKALWAAFDNDIHFYEKFDDTGFEFRYRLLPSAAREAGDELLLLFYEILKGGTGFSKLNGQQLARLNGAILEQLYRQANKKYSICPACLAAWLPPPVDGISQNDREHYFPQSIYPPLAVHPFNLAIACIMCNQRRHSDTDPIFKHKAGALLDSFVPYSRPGIDDIELQFNPGEPSRMVRLAGKQGKTRAGTRARNFDRMYKLSQYWSGILEVVDRNLFMRVTLGGSAPTLENVRKELEHIVKVNEAIKFTQPTAFLEGRYAAWLLDESLDTWLKSWKDTMT
jgi:hypothetical protein